VGRASTEATARERELIDRACGGDESAFAGLVEPYRAALHAHCYRMLGSIDDAEDALQDALLRAWRGLPRFTGPSRLRPWLYRIATNVCLDAIAGRPRRMHPLDYGPPAGPGVGAPEGPLLESVWVDPYPDERLGMDDGYAAPHARYEQREAVELAFIAALQHLPARQRAALILRDVLGFSAKESGEALGASPASVNSALQRARRAVDARLPQRSQQATLRALGDERLRDIVQRYIDAWERADVAAIVALLAEDATVAMPPWATWWSGRDVIAGFVRRDGGDQWHYVPARASGQLAAGVYRRYPGRARYAAEALEVFTLEGPRIKDITAYAIPELFRHFGLPDELARSAPR
jgi:RNA polymerase sigma-70 factor, ECF subfamily